MYRFFLFVKGYYLITVEGLLAERFINLCKVKNIYLWDLQNSNNIYRMKISIEDYNILDDIMNKTGVKVDILEKYGLPFCDCIFCIFSKTIVPAAPFKKEHAI